VTGVTPVAAEQAAAAALTHISGVYSPGQILTTPDFQMPSGLTPLLSLGSPTMAGQRYEEDAGMFAAADTTAATPLFTGGTRKRAAAQEVQTTSQAIFETA